MATDGDFLGDFESGVDRGSPTVAAGSPGRLDGVADDPSQHPVLRRTPLPPPVLPPALLPPPVVPPPDLVPASTTVRSAPPPSGGRSRESIQEIHRRTTEHMRAARSAPRRSRAAVVVRIVLLLVVAASIVTGLFMVSRITAATDSPALPVYDTVRPSHGTVTLVGEGEDAGGPFSYEATTNADSSAFRITGTFDGMPFGVVGSPEGVFTRSGAGGWVRLDGVDDAEIQRHVDATRAAVGVVRVPIYTDFVPASARPFVEVHDQRDVVIDGRSLRRIELVVDVADFERSDPRTFDRWVSSLDLSPADDRAEHVRVVLSVDAEGVVWRVESWADEGGHRFREDLVAWDDAEFVPEIPATTEVPDSGVATDVSA
jgi:hypothetical protein